MPVQPETPHRRATDKAPAGAQTESASIRVGIDKVDQLINLVGELVITQAMLAQTASEVDPVIYEKLLNGLSQLERNTRDLQESVMSIRMMPISFAFSRFPRVVRDLASKLKKKVELVTIGEGTELDKGLIEKITDPLTHLVRNSLDHGIELPEQRIAAGKPAQGTITLQAAHQGGNVVISVSDDGAGLNREKILAKAREKDIPVNDAMPDSEVWQLIFAPGFSTADVVTDVSGRGVGMDVVKRNILAMGGQRRNRILRRLGQPDHHPPAADSGDSGRHVDCGGRPDLHHAADFHHRIAATHGRRSQNHRRQRPRRPCARRIFAADRLHEVFGITPQS